MTENPNSQSDRVIFQQIVSIDCPANSDLDFQTIETENPESTLSAAGSVPVSSAKTDAEVIPEPAKIPAALEPQNGRIYRIDDKHDRFQPGRLLRESRLHVSVKASPSEEQLEIEQMIREKRAVRISQGSEIQQIVVSAYQSIPDTDEISEIHLEANQGMDSVITQLNLPQKIDSEPEPVTASVQQAAIADAPTDLVDVHQAAVTDAPTDLVDVHQAADTDAPTDLVDTEQHTEPEWLNSENERKASGRDSDSVQKSNSAIPSQTEKPIKPAWEVVSFRWPSTIRKLCSEHRSAFQRLLDSLQQNQEMKLSRIGVMHAVPGQGATTLATCMAKILAESGMHVMLTDLDLERPGLEDAANIQLKEGWQGMLENDLLIDEYLVRDASENLTLMPLKKQLNLVSKRALLLEKIQEISGQIARQFDYSILDIGNVQNLMIEENCHVGFLDGAVIVSDTTGFESTAVSIYEKLVAAGVPSVVIAENFRSPSRSAA